MSNQHASYIGELRINGSRLGRRDDLLAKTIYQHLPPLRGGNVRWPSRDDLRSFDELNRSVYSELQQSGIEIDGKSSFNRRFKMVLDLMVSDQFHFLIEREGSYARSNSRLELSKTEVHYYPAIQDELDRFWALETGREYHHRHRLLAVLDTHHAGRAATGAWARPDLTAVGGKVLPFLPGKFVDVHTFEVKFGLPLLGIYEALAHRRFSHYSSVLCIWREEWDRPDARSISTIVKEAVKQGIGLMLLNQYDDYSSWEELAEPTRYEPDPQALNDFLQQQARRDGFGHKLQSWIQRKDHVMPPVRTEDVELLMFTTDELNIAQSIIERLSNTEEEELLSREFPEFQESPDAFKKVRYQLNHAGFIRIPQHKIGKANWHLFEPDQTGPGEST